MRLDSKKLLLLTALGLAVLVSSIFVWRFQDRKATAAKLESEILKGLSADDLSAIVKSHGAGGQAIVATPETKQVFIKGLKEYLALAAQARREGMADDPNFKLNFEYKKRILLSDLYGAKLEEETGEQVKLSDDELETVWKDAANEKLFSAELAAIRSVQLDVARQRGQDDATVPELAGGALIKARRNWARTRLMSDRALADADFMARPEIALRTRVYEAGILSSDYLRKHWPDQIKASDREISQHLAIHPELDVRKKYEKAASVLQRVKAGEDFGKLAKEFSEDRTSKVDGGLYKDVTKNLLWIEVENSALSLGNGQIADRLIETDTGFHIVKLDSKRTEKGSNGEEIVKFNVRHILFQKTFEDPGHLNPGIPASFLSALEIARNEVEKGKRRGFIERIVAESGIELPEDFAVE